MITGTARTDGRGRFAPSPTGDLHLGSAATALLSYLFAKREGGAYVLRVEDLDRARTVPGMVDRQIEDLAWMGLCWDEGPDCGGPSEPYRQSERDFAYDAALAELTRLGLVYPCDCSRAEIARVASAPHAGDEGPIYPGTCRVRATGRKLKRPPALRFRTPSHTVTVNDELQGSWNEDVATTVGDFVLRRGDGVYAYQLAVVVDDAAMRIDYVVRGADLMASTARQIVLLDVLGQRVPRYAHVPLLVRADGARLAKRDGSASLRAWRSAGGSAGQMLCTLATTLGCFARDSDSGGVPLWRGRAGDSAPAKEVLSALLGAFEPQRLRGKKEMEIDVRALQELSSG